MTIDFAAIDFETANEFRGSPCAIGLALVRNGKIVEEHRLLMRPPHSSGPDDFASFNVDLHGISWEMVKNESEFLDIWNSLTPIIGDLPLVAHNAAFDIGVLRDALEMSGVLWPSLSYTCTLITSRRILSLPSYSLRYVAAELKLDLGKHHDALDDARTSARIMLELCGRTSQKSLDSFLQSVSVGWGKLSEGHWQGSTVQQSRSHHRIRRELPEPRSDASPDHFLFGKNVVLTGALPGGILRSAAHDRIAYFGGTPQEKVTRETSILVVGDIQPHTLAPGAEITSKMKKAFTLQSQGQNLEIMAGFDFLPWLE